MKVTKKEGYMSNDGCLWVRELDAVDNNINDVICLADLNTNDSWSILKDKLYLWFKNNPKEIKYMLNNINKLYDENDIKMV